MPNAVHHRVRQTFFRRCVTLILHRKASLTDVGPPERPLWTIDAVRSFATAQSAFSMGCLFGPVAANRHRTPTAGASPRSIHEHQGTTMPFANLDVPEVIFTYNPGHRLRDWK
jgi:hypothetical protein